MVQLGKALGFYIRKEEYEMVKEEKKPEKKKMINKELRNKIIEYSNESGGNDKEELILAGKLFGRGHLKVFAEFHESMENEPREVVIQI